MRTSSIVAACAFALAAPAACADAVTEWNAKAGEIVVEAKLGTPPALRAMALVQTAVHASLDGLPRDASADAAVAAANRATLVKVLPSQQAAVEAAYRAALTRVADGPSKAAGIAAGERAASAVLAVRAGDLPATPDAYRPHTTPGAYVPTVAPAALAWPQRKPWLLASARDVRPGPPPALGSAAWARDYNEVKALGARDSALRTPEQTEIARFWEYSLPPIYFGVVRSAADAPGRDPVRNARLFAAVAQAMDDAMIAVFEAKYRYDFWRPSTAIRNGDIDGNDATERDPTWVSLIDAPLHPEYPSAHSILAAAVGTVLLADLGNAVPPVLATSSPTAKGATRRWTRVEDFMQEVADARVYEGIHFRSATEAGLAMGRAIGRRAAEALLVPPL